jgi:N-dimethylarginine dimethylaminohydrolase
MKRLYIRIIFLMLFIVVVGVVMNTATDKDETANKRVSVNYEWGKLEEVVLGTAEYLTIPGYFRTIDSGFGYSPENREWIMNYGGVPLEESDPADYRKVKHQIDALATVLEDRGIRVHRPEPSKLSPGEMTFMADLQKGSSFLFARDPTIVIGNHIIEASLKLPMRVKEIFAARSIILPILKGSNAKYTAVPSVSPAFADDGIYLEGGDIILNGSEIYVGNSGNASSEAGIEWLQNYLGSDYNVEEVKVKDFQHLDCVLSLIRPGLGLICREAIVGELPPSLTDWDFIPIPLEEARKLACNVLVLDEQTVIIDERFCWLGDELRKRGETVIEIPYDAVTEFGGGFRSSHHPIRRTDS